MSRAHRAQPVLRPATQQVAAPAAQEPRGGSDHLLGSCPPSCRDCPTNDTNEVAGASASRRGGQGATRRALLAGLASLGATLAGAACGPSATERRLLSTAPLEVRPAPAPTPRPLPPVRLPADEAPHDTLAEWWYYTGHLYDEGAEYGFELVFFRGVRGGRPPGYAAHFAITDLARRLFRFDQRQDVALNEQPAPRTWQQLGLPGPDAAPPPGIVSTGGDGGGFRLRLGDWRMEGFDGHDHLAAAMAGYALDLDLAATRPPALHAGIGLPGEQPGLISFGPAGYSYYYSRTRMAATGLLTINGAAQPVTGEAWMDHQWGDFLVLGGGGWDWFSAQLADGRDLTLSLIRDASGATIAQYGTLVGTDGEAHHLAPGDFTVEALDIWTSPRTGITYPSGWRVRLPAAALDLRCTPLLREQELDARASSGVIYWEGAVAVEDFPSGAALGRGYVELTGYGAR